MKREFLQGLTVEGVALPKELIDAIMAENGRDIEAARKPYGDYESLKQQLALYENVDVQQLTQQAKHWEQKYQQQEALHRQQLAQLEFSGQVRQQLILSGARNLTAVTALLDLDALRQARDPVQALQTAIGQLQKEEGYLFSQEQTPPPYARGTGARQRAEDTAPTGLAGALREKFERK